MKLVIGAAAVLAVLAVAAWRFGATGIRSQDAVQGSQAGTGPHQAQAGGEEEHGPPEGWKFTFPKGGDPVKGRAVFVKFQCFSCHEVKGESFRPPDPSSTMGPELSAMAAHHPPEFFAESVINPGAVIDKGRGYEAPDGSSKMPSFNEDMTVKDLMDLVAYLTSLKPPAGTAATPAPSAPAAHTDQKH